jgi:hypothetical protein
MKNININIGRLIEICENRSKRCFTSAPDYAEPGYLAPEKGIIIGNWNPACGFNVDKATQGRDPVSKLARVLEAQGCELEWSDEWDTCCDCGKAVRTSGDCYQWTPYFRIVNECERVCLDCLDPEEYLASIEDDTASACPPQIDPEKFGYIKYNGDFETGFHPGQTDDPKTVLKKMHDAGMTGIVFKIAEQSQFYTVWQAFHKPS